MRHEPVNFPSFLAVALALASTLACEQPPPPGYEGDASSDEHSGDGDPSADGSESADTTSETAGETDATETGEDPGGPFDATLYPLTDGATWTYLATNYSGQILREEIVDAVEVEWEGQTAWMLVDNPNVSGEFTKSTIIRDGPHTLRVHKEIEGLTGTVEIVDYDPGFTRAHDDWDTPGQSMEYAYERVATDGAGLNMSVEPRAHLYTVLDVDVEVTVPAGTFDCVQVERIRTHGTNVGERVIFWYARGVGKVREERPMEARIEELVSVAIPDGAECP